MATAGLSVMEILGDAIKLRDETTRGRTGASFLVSGKRPIQSNRNTFPDRYRANKVPLSFTYATFSILSNG